MTSKPSYNPSALIKLAERTEYEAWLLEAVYDLVEQKLFPIWPDAVVYPLNDPKARFIIHASANIDLGDWRPGFLKVGKPLVFVSTFKLLDMLLEWIIEENGQASRLNFEQKKAFLQCSSSLVFPPSIESRVWLKERLVGLYGILEPLRGTIIHNKHFTITDGTIRVSSTKKGTVGPVVEINAPKLRELTRTIFSILRYVDGTWQLDQVREKFLRYALDELETLHGFPLLGQMRPYHTGVRVFSASSNPLLVDPRAIGRDLATRCPDQDCSFDLRILVVEGGEVVDAYFLPWRLFAVSATDWHQGIDVEQYKTAIPDDIKPEDLG